MSRRTFEGSSNCAAPASTVWTVWSNPTEWPGGIIQSTSIDGEFVVGAKIRGKVKGGPATTSTITDINEPRSWVGVSRFPGLTMTYEHTIEDVEDGTVLTERVIMDGPLAGIAGQLMGKNLKKTFAGTTGRIAELAEARIAR
ncbi:SRPBCC family protein [Mycolicibacterium litorale]|uniref:SRPBCC family protein n=1 Tax=Mycolicibacterium litorale TaxID=758802 RepID=UPI0016244299|nr:SRPBCC family protein [Mycolicibacterium litorale]